jgi:DNA-binding NtrC family response regulator
MAAHLFGVVKGAYTGAATSREGVLGRANAGTLFLDEIGNLSLELQKSLLLVLQEGAYRPVGAVKEIITDIKIVVATNENLAALVRAGRFREDLYMRLNPATAVTLPSLRERRDDFEELLAWFMRQVVAEAYNRDLLAQYAEQRGLVATAPISVGRGVPPRGDGAAARKIHFLLHPSSFKLLHDFEWPGNFRQFAMTLSNLVTFTLVELVERAERIEPEASGEGRPDVIPIPPKIVSDLLRPMTPPEEPEVELGLPIGPRQLLVEVPAADSLNAVSCAVERQYLEQLYERCAADLGRMGELLLGDEGAGRKVQLRMNQLGIKLRNLRRKTVD